MSDVRVYIVGPSPDGPMKVGASGVGDIRHRLNNLQPGYPGKLYCYGEYHCPVAWLAEMKAHDLLMNRKIYSEWFDVTAAEANAAVAQAILMAFPDTRVLERDRLPAKTLYNRLHPRPAIERRKSRGR